VISDGVINERFLRAHGHRKGDEHPAYTPVGVRHTLSSHVYMTYRYTGHIPGLRDQVGVTFGCATTQLLQPDSGGAASTPAWTGPSAVRPQWSVPGSQVEERPAWLGDAFDYYTAKQAPRSCHCSRSVLEVKGQGHSRGRAHGACEYENFLNIFC